MVSGRRKRIMVACVTFETVKITDPIWYYDINKVHLIHFVKEPESESGKIYCEFYDRVVAMIHELDSGIEIVEHHEDVNDNLAMMRTVMSIMEREYRENPNADIFVNTSAGTSQYSSAATLASMMYPPSIPFVVRTKRYTTSGHVRELFYKDGVPVGETSESMPPEALIKYNIPLPDYSSVLGLRILDYRNRNEMPTSGPVMIDLLKKNGLWHMGCISVSEGKSPLGRKEAVYYHRDFVTKWVNSGWAEPDNYSRKYLVTEEGKKILRIFYTDVSLIFE